MIGIVASMQHHDRSATPPAGALRKAAALTGGPAPRAMWIGRIVSGLAVLFLTFDAAVKLLQLPIAVEANQQLGYPVGVIPVLGVLEIACLIVYLIPRTAALGAILWTGYLGGAVATHVRVENPLFSHTLFPIYVGAFLWVGLWLRDRRVRTLLERP